MKLSTKTKQLVATGAAIASVAVLGLTSSSITTGFSTSATGTIEIQTGTWDTGDQSHRFKCDENGDKSCETGKTGDTDGPKAKLAPVKDNDSPDSVTGNEHDGNGPQAGSSDDPEGVNGNKVESSQEGVERPADKGENTGPDNTCDTDATPAEDGDTDKTNDDDDACTDTDASGNESDASNDPGDNNGGDADEPNREDDTTDGGDSDQERASGDGSSDNGPGTKDGPPSQEHEPSDK